MTTHKPQTGAPAAQAAPAPTRSAPATAPRKDPLAWIARWYGPVALTAFHK